MEIQIKEVTTTKRFEYSDGDLRLGGSYVLNADGAVINMSASAVINNRDAGYVNGNRISGVMRFCYQEIENTNVDAVKAAVEAVMESENGDDSVNDDENVNQEGDEA